MGAISAGACGPLFKHGFGPSWDLAFTQSNFAVVTKLGIWLMPRPEAFVSAKVHLAEEEDLALAVDILRPLRLDGTINGVPNIRNALGGAIAVSRREQWYSGAGPIPDEVKVGMRRKLGLGWWLLQYGIYGREEVVRAQAKAVRQRFENVPGARIEEELFDAAAIASPDRGGAGSRAAIPSLNALGIVDWWGGSGGHIDFSPVLPPRGEDALKLHRLCRSIIEEAGLDYMGTFYNFGRAMALICAITFDREDEARTAALRPMFSRLIERAAAAGYGEYRTHVRYMDEVAGIYDWNGGALAALNARVKDALDPHGILAPGKQGIWPARLRT
jgi:4-cresol dehydrogenase (hydroxylating)